VNISIAELQMVNPTDIKTWMLAVGDFATNNAVVDDLFFLALVSLMLYGLKRSYEKDKFTFSCLLAIMVISIYTITRGIRFTEFSSGLFIAVAATGFGHLIMATKGKDAFISKGAIGLGLTLSVLALFLGLYMGPNLGPDTNANWDNAWTFLRTQTPELSLVGTWWDPGHMITGVADRRVMADGAHCADQCLYGINDRITSLGKIMATSDENTSLELIRKYQGDSPKVYWIASDDLISKYQWLQYFGLGCNAQTDPNCQLYTPIGLQSYKYDQNGNPIIGVYGPIMTINIGKAPIAVYVQGKNAALLNEVLYYENGSVRSYDLSGGNVTDIVQSVSPLMKQLGYRMTNQTVPITVWVEQGNNMLVVIPPNLRNTVFTRMFFLEGNGLQHFKQVFRNEQVKIYEVEF
jgi:asparagine N-glycosylation enzyme membrane subunit Stt3